jgi:hypothetical protein
VCAAQIGALELVDKYDSMALQSKGSILMKPRKS